MLPAESPPFAPLPLIWAAGESVDLRIWAVVLGVGLTLLIAELVRMGLRARRESRDASARPASTGPIVNPTLGVVPLRLEPNEPNSGNPRYFRYLGPFRDEDRAPERPAMPWRRVACPPLRGRVVLVSLFVGADGRGWSEEEIARHLGALERAAKWMEEQAGDYGAAVGVGVSDVYFQVDGESTPETDVVIAQSGGEVGLFEADMTVRALTLMSRAAAAQGFRDAVDFVQEVAARLPDATVAWLLHLRLAGRSYAVPLDRTELDGVSLAFCHARQANFTEPLIRPPVPRAAVIAHEILHLFGAQDKYGWPLSHFPPRSVTRRDVMRLDSERLSELRVDPLTAAELGWTA
ncbi:hypothetical protein [Planctomyces sp. SH-PL62]|uniref:hypothetical protein n=1 Tax=Planctomyces sp. SH-PL62 TaxID=1636152 RepID=UPI00078CD20A|nr:hypothetical protein [Planctomyces sp. SH-PL62]AMV39880.1 hypothetical protein VT85_20780 [Planctomyces sp. SH-PL62]